VSKTPEMITTPGGYVYAAPVIEGQPDVAIELTYAEAYDVLLDGIMNEATIEPITAETYPLLAENLLGLLIDASEGTDPTEDEL
jgi:hypothetical protein